MKFRIDGTVMQTVNVELDDGESVYSESGAMGWMSGNIEMKTESKGGVAGGLGRMFSGESLFLTNFTAKGGKGFVAFNSEYPGKIIKLELKEGEEMVCEKDAFMLAQQTVKLSTHLNRKLGAGLLGGEGFVLQKISGPGTAFLNFSGEITEMELKEGQLLKVDTGCVAMFEPTVKFDIVRVAGAKNFIFGGEGLFLATLSGPGKVWLQSMPISGLAGAIRKYIPTKS
ncbi:MAG: TIGR00266 family protein [Candidatus ainarchaeum sp.]|nr:TIGR00266 family protein [Candidatus ainarchaeum sp.]